MHIWMFAYMKSILEQIFKTTNYKWLYNFCSPDKKLHGFQN